MRAWDQAWCTIILPTSAKEEPFSPFAKVGLACETTVTRAILSYHDQWGFRAHSTHAFKL